MSSSASEHFDLYRNIWTQIQSYSSIWVVSHYSPDPDAYGSQCGLGSLLMDQGKSVELINQDGALSSLDFIPFQKSVVAEVPSSQPELIITCDCGDRKRVGDQLWVELSKFDVPVMNIDHHVSNDNFGKWNLVLPECSSTSEIIYWLAKANNLKLNPDAATCLLAGIMADTGSFRYSNTKSETFAAASGLIEHGANLPEMGQHLYGSTPKNVAQMQCQAILDASFLSDGKLAEVVVTKDFLSRFHATSHDTENLVEKARDIFGVRIASFMREDEDLWKVSLRTSDSQVNLSQVAQEFGGGGHRAAAAFRWRGSLKELQSKLRDRLAKELSGD